MRASLPDLRPKDLRDSLASHLLTAGVQLGYVSTQLGHADVAVTARHYARYVGSGADYIEPPTLARHELPADLLARLKPSKAAFDPRLGPSERASAH